MSIGIEIGDFLFPVMSGWFVFDKTHLYIAFQLCVQMTTKETINITKQINECN